MDMFGTLLDELIDASPRVSFGDGVTLFCQGYLLVKFRLRTNTHKSSALGKHDCCSAKSRLQSDVILDDQDGFVAAFDGCAARIIRQILSSRADRS
jgi:hypothetical protein